MKKRSVAFLPVLAVIVCVIAVVPKRGRPEFTVGICQFSQHESLNAATRGFKAALSEKLGDRVSFEEQNANGDFALCGAGVNDLISKDVDLILANSTNVLQAAANATADIPILGTAVTDYGQDMAENISGTSDMVRADEVAAMIQELFPEERRIGMIYCSSESNSHYQVKALETELGGMEYTCKEYRFVDSSDLSSVTMAAASECDVLYIPTDNTVASNAELIANICIPAGVPVVPGDESTCKICGAAVLAVDYYDLGYTTGEMAAEILADGKKISDLPVRYASSFTRKYNEELCGQLGIRVPETYTVLEAG